MKTKYSSYCINGIARGCRYCIKGEKLVLFISGKCQRNCWYCSLSKKRKNKDVIWANERICKNPGQAIKEAAESNATSCGITGGDPFLFLSRTIKFARALKKRFGKKFHIHIYLPTKLLAKEKLRKLSKYVDEIRFHPEFLINPSPEIIEEDINKINLASLFFKKENIGVELPMIPGKKKEILGFITKISKIIGFINLNEFELSETNFDFVTKNYRLNRGGYTIKDSVKAGNWLLRQIKKLKLKIKVHLCTAETKNNYQFKNRLKKHNILPLGRRTKEGLVEYLCIYFKNKKEMNKETRKMKKLILKNPENQFYADKKKNRIILLNNFANKLLGKYKIMLVEEFPTFDGIEAESQEVMV